MRCIIGCLKCVERAVPSAILVTGFRVDTFSKVAPLARRKMNPGLALVSPVILIDMVSGQGVPSTVQCLHHFRSCPEDRIRSMLSSDFTRRYSIVSATVALRQTGDDILSHRCFLAAAD